MRTTAVETNGQLRRDREILLKFGSGALVACPTCGTPVRTMDKHLRELEARIPRLDKQATLTWATLARIEQARQAVQTYQTWKQAHDQQLASLQAQLANLQEITPPTDDPAELQQDLATLHAVESALTSARQLAQQASAKSTTAVTQLKGATQRQKELQGKLAATAITNEELAKVEKSLQQHSWALQEAAIHRTAAGMHQQQMKNTQLELDQLTAKLERNRKARNFAAKLTILREDVFHRQKLPLAVAGQNLTDMEAGINSVLEDFGSPFWVEADADLLFTVHFPGEPPKSVLRLSGGQRGVFAVAFRLSVASLFDADLNLLVLDEPTAGMDPDNVNYLTAALTKYAAKIRGKRQVIIITHADVRSACDQVIDLTPTAA
jgi:DNA repair exonuclease SbcCD ATPase subunit